MSEEKVREATVYLQLAPRPPGPGPQWDFGSQATVVRSTTTKPDNPLPGVIVLRLRLRVPAAAWGPFEPEAVIEVPADLIQHPITVEAEDPQ